MFLARRLLQCVKRYFDGDLGASARRGEQAQRATQLTRSLLHDGNAEVAAQGGPGILEAAAVIANGKGEPIALVFKTNGDIGGLGVTDGI